MEMKAILVIDVEEYGDYYVDVYRKDADDRFEGRYYLKPLPEKKPVSYHDDLYGDVEKNYTNIGWNLCLEELEK